MSPLGALLVSSTRCMAVALGRTCVVIGPYAAETGAKWGLRGRIGILHSVFLNDRPPPPGQIAQRDQNRQISILLCDLTEASRDRNHARDSYYRYVGTTAISPGLALVCQALSR